MKRRHTSPRSVGRGEYSRCGKVIRRNALGVACELCGRPASGGMFPRCTLHPLNADGPS